MRMSDDQIRKLFTELEKLSKVVEETNRETRDVVATAVEAVERAARKVELVHAGYHEHGTSIEHLRLTVAKLRLRCPLLGSSEHPVVCPGKEDGECPGGDS